MESPINANEHESKHWDLGHDIMGAFYGVYHELGHGSPEAVYEEALAIGFREAGFTVARHVATPIWFRGRVIGEYKADLVVNGAVLLKLKAGEARESTDSQLSKGERHRSRPVAEFWIQGAIPAFCN